MRVLRRKNSIFITSLALFTLALCYAFRPALPNADEIVKKADERLKGKSSYSDLTIQIVRPSWKRDMTMKCWTKGNDYAMILITSPAKDKGTVTLKRIKEVWNWMPSIERTIKLPPSMMMESWMGTDFTNDDLVKQSSMVDDYTHQLAGDSTIEKLPCYKIIMKPKPNAAVVWGKIAIFIDKKDYMEMRVEYYDEDGVLVDIMTGSDVKMLGGKLLPAKMEMIPVSKPGQKTVLLYNSMKFDQPMDDNFFTVQNMQKVQ